MKRLFIFLSFGFFYSHAQQCCPYMNGFTVQPNPATDLSQVFVISDITTPNSSVKRNTQWVVDAAEKRIIIDYCFEDGMLAVLTNYKDTVLLGAIQSGTYSVKIVATLGDSLCQNNTHTNMMTGTAVINNVTGLHQNPSAEKLRVGLDPDRDQLRLYNFPQGAEVMIFDLSGRKVLEKADWQGSPIDLHMLPPGCYVIECRRQDLNMRGKFIKCE